MYIINAYNLKAVRSQVVCIDVGNKHMKENLNTIFSDNKSLSRLIKNDLTVISSHLKQFMRQQEA